MKHSFSRDIYSYYQLVIIETIHTIVNGCPPVFRKSFTESPFPECPFYRTPICLIHIFPDFFLPHSQLPELIVYEFQYIRIVWSWPTLFIKFNLSFTFYLTLAPVNVEISNNSYNCHKFFYFIYYSIKKMLFFSIIILIPVLDSRFITMKR